jgi:NADPH-dependent ferric siderophore reductase
VGCPYGVRRLFTAGDDDLASRVRDELGTHPADYVWAATASLPARRIRALLRRELRRIEETYSVLAYWVPDREDYQRKLVEAGLSLS